MSADQLKQDIEATREDISRDVEALTYKASPGRVVHDRLNKATSGIAGLKEKVMGSSDDGPGVTERVSGHASGVASDIGEAAGSAASTASSAASSAASTASSAASTAKVQVRERTEGNPLAAGIIAFGFGWLVSSLIPASKVETRLAGQASEVAKEHGQPLAERAKETARDMGQQLRGDLEPRAQEAAQAVKGKAQDGVSTVKDEGASAAADVKNEVREQASGDSGTGTKSASTYGDTPAYTDEPAYPPAPQEARSTSVWSLEERQR